MFKNIFILDSGQGLMEYSLLFSLIVIIVIIALESLGISILGLLSNIGIHL